ncbi:hypothetical protein TWF569_009094 [Orbilia oligospora]|uniref:BTB domain-containing protein n=1 Tax=Orbilia oligospora TaxID=2813651 RepID=A0A7C8NL06_ORBOL|nr:hypothetical protein TWF102_009802 [Orbilia oligospora]KAF3138011.1 hypothetical protein TWF569_009094 [Orbilia oligospora]KAF3153226.1 hypothetical protein TWF594_000255 [Orbilia oligospora]
MTSNPFIPNFRLGPTIRIPPTHYPDLPINPYHENDLPANYLYITVSPSDGSSSCCSCSTCSDLELKQPEIQYADMSAPTTSNPKGVIPKKDDESPPHQIGLVLDSEVIRITAGEDKPAFYVHRAVLEKSDSPILKQVISGKFKEGRGENGLDWSSEDPETVRRFLTYLYSGDYYVPKPELKRSADELQNGVESGSGTAQAGNATEQGKKSKTDPDEQGVEQTGAIVRPLTPVQYHLEHIRLPTWRQNTDAGDLEHTPRAGKEFAFGEAMLAHSRLYVFAQYHLLKPLEVLTLQRLTQVMVLAETHSHNLEADILPIVEYTYHADDLNRPGDLCELVSQFVAIHFHRFEGEEFYEILEAGGGFVRDVCSKLGRQLMANELKSNGGRGRVAQKAYGKTGKLNRVHPPGPCSVGPVLDSIDFLLMFAHLLFRRVLHNGTVSSIINMDGE